MMEDKLKNNSRSLLKMQLALKSYEDDNGTNIPLLDEINIKIVNFKEIRSYINAKEQIRISNEIINDFNKVFDFVGRDKFIFYDDGNIDYIGKSQIMLEDKLKNNSCSLLKMQLALKSFEDDNGTNIPLLDEINIKLGNFKEIRDSINSKEQIKILYEIIKDFNKVFDFVGRDKFVFLNNGNIDYKGKEQIMLEDKLNNNMCVILELDLAFESYEDDTGNNIPLLDETNLKLGNFRKIRNSINIKEQIKISNEIIKDFNKGLDLVGRDKFIFYDNGNIDYTWIGRSKNPNN